MFDPRRRSVPWPAFVTLVCLVAGIAGCASPAAPRPPSLRLPEPVHDLTAVRSGDRVQLRFSVPRRSTDGQALGVGILQGSVCRQETLNAACRPVPLDETEATLHVPDSTQGAMVLWTDTLSPELRAGAPRPLIYRVTLRNVDGHSAGPSEPAYAAAGQAPATVEQFTAEGTRLGILLRWSAAPDAGEVLLERTQVEPKPETPKALVTAPISTGKRSKSGRPAVSPRTENPAVDPGTVWLKTEAQGPQAGATIDAAAVEGVRYRYVAVRQFTAQAGGRTLELRSLPSSPHEVIWRDVYPPPAPQDLTALGYFTGSHGAERTSAAQPLSGYAVDLIWDPVNDPRVTGYLVTRQRLDAAGKNQGSAERLTGSAVKTPAFHDVTAESARAYRYFVVAVDARGNSSAAAETVVSPQSR